MVPVRLIFQPDQVFAVLPAHELPDRRNRTLHKIEHPHRTAGPKRAVKCCKHLPPFLVVSQVVEHGSSQHYVKLAISKRYLADVALDRCNSPSSHATDSFPRSVKHWLAQVD